MIFYILCGIWLLYVVTIFPILTHIRISELKSEIAKLRNKDIPPEALYKQEYAAAVIEDVPEIVTEPTMKVAARVMSQEIKVKPSKNIEQQLGTRLPVWIGSISLLFAGFYMIQYSIESGLLSPAVRLIISSIFGMVLVVASFWIGKNPNFSNSKRITQALAGAGIGVLYFSIFAATNIYEFISVFLGFVGMSVVTALCIIGSLTHGAPIALMGLICGLLTPAVMQGEINTLLLFGYLYVIILGCFLVIKRNNWWWLAGVAIFGAFTWAYVWGANYVLIPGISLLLELFIIAVFVTFLAISNNNTPRILKQSISILTLLFFLDLTVHNNYSLSEWGMFSIIVLGSIILAIRDPKTYLPFVWGSMFLTILMLFAWNPSNGSHMLLLTLGFGILFTLSSYMLIWQNNIEKCLVWIIPAATANIVFFILAYIKVDHSYNLPWGLCAGAFAIVWVVTHWALTKKYKTESKFRTQILSVSCATSIGLSSIAAMLILNSDYWIVFFAAELLALSWLDTKLDSSRLNVLALILVMPQICGLVYYFKATNNMPSSQLISLATTAVLLGVSGKFFRMKITESSVQVIEFLSTLFIAVFGVGVLHNIIAAYMNKLNVTRTLLEGSLVNIYYILLGFLSLILLGEKYKRPAYQLSGLLLIAFACIKIIAYEIFYLGLIPIHLYTNPVDHVVKVGSTPVFNLLLLAYVFPAVLLILGRKKINNYLINHKLHIDICLLPLLLIFFWLSLSVDQYFHGSVLNSGASSNVEIYMYSIVWLLYGLSLLIFGTLFKQKSLRVASLVLLILTISKVFLYDAAELSGILRVLSFLGLGLSLIAISWFYSRFVFKKD